MKTNKISAALIVLTICITIPLAALDDSNTELFFNEHSINPTLAGFFTSSMDSINAKTVALEKHHLFSIYTNFGTLAQGGNILAAAPIPLYRSEYANFALPLFVTYTGTNSGYDDYTFNEGNASNSGCFDIEYSGLMFGGGLMYYGKYGLLAGYVGFSREKGREYDYEWSENKRRWSISPIINAKKLPLLDSFINLISGFYSMDNLQMNRNEFKPTYKVNVLFRPFGVFALNVYTKKDWYNPDAKYNIYGGKLDIGNKAVMLRMDAGYREFFDVLPGKKTFGNGLYTKISLNLIAFNFMGISVFAESGSTPHFSEPTYGFIMSLAFNGDHPLAYSINTPAKFGGFNQAKKDNGMFEWEMGVNGDMYLFDWD